MAAVTDRVQLLIAYAMLHAHRFDGRGCRQWECPEWPCPAYQWARKTWRRGVAEGSRLPRDAGV